MPENNGFVSALEHRYRSQVEEATTIIKLYLSQPQAVADHSNFLEELDCWVGKLAEAKDKLRALEAVTNSSSSDSGYTVTVDADLLP